MQSLIKKYSPKTSKEVFGQDRALANIKSFITNYKDEKKKAALLYGPCGTGKTSSVYAIANDLDLEVIELNASDLRNKGSIGSVLGAASQQMSLFGKGKVILVDEVDGISGKSDYGGLSEIVKLIQKSKYPIIITANNPYDNKFSSLRRKCEMIEFAEVSVDFILEILKNVCGLEGIKYTDDGLKMISRRCGGDVRAALNDLEIVSCVSNDVKREDIDELSGRDKLETMLKALVKIFKAKDPEIAIKAFDNVSEDINQQMLWIDENLPLEYNDPEDLCRAYDALSKADVFLGRIRRWQHWRFLVYANSMISAGIAVAKDNKNPGFVKYKPTGRILKIWWAKQKSMKKKAISQKVAEATHTSTKRVIEDIEYLKAIFKSDNDMANAITEECKLDKEEVLWLKK